ncbi:DUF1697 domain-containing protein [Furfurilactobacillus siliginis]|uniref:DUF1697 domain-containing protein n=1 Tax=Furfurilactobacillus siliginis TaxID=348151 RepID=A0A0R2LDZ0_9LACO|nr:DUF1697 domain-containing protein [Furfurilactobacillus siliginis]KRN97290.1 hypothetical protein IV55_GL000218 [Furfurilactobacillus siliginis]GEK28601.1 hypothetical protein LSI01_09120 [Furfurilactobacillus siliginis]
MDYLLLLRGVNVGGNHRVPMAELRAQLEQAGFTNVASYINSGNLLFASDAPVSEVEALVERILLQEYDWSIPFTLLSQGDIAELIVAAPIWWGEREDWRHNALFKLHGYQTEFDQLILDKVTEEYDQVFVTAHVIFWSSPSKVHYSRALYAKMLNEPFYPEVSIRNRNTTLKLAAMMEKRADEELDN